MPVQFHMLGSLTLLGPDGASVGKVLAQTKRTAFLSYLAAASPKGFHRRDKLVGLFWPHLDQQHARAAVRKTLHFLRQHLGEGVVVTRGDEEVGLGPAVLWSDVAAFEDAVNDGHLYEALKIYRGDFLEGFFINDCPEFERWLDRERLRLREKAATAAWTHALDQIGEGALVEAERTAQRALGWVPTDESAVRSFLEALASGGDRAAAVRFFEKFSKRLEEELELEPAPETRELVETIRSRKVAVEPPARSTPAIPNRRSSDGKAPVTDPPDASPPRLFESRHLGEWALLGVAGAWAVFECVGIVGARSGWSPVVLGSLPMITAFAFLVLVVLAWHQGERRPGLVSRSRLLIAAVLLVVAGAALSAVPATRSPDLSGGAAGGSEDRIPPVIAVLPFKDVSGTEAEPYFADGIHGQILTQLFKIRSLQVISGRSVQGYRDSSDDLRTIGEALRARYIGVGEVLRGQDTVCVNAQLVDVERDRIVWAETFHRSITVSNLHAIESEIARAYAAAVHAALTTEELEELGQLPTDHLEAYELYLRGNVMLDRLHTTGYSEQSLLNMLELFGRAVELDPGFTLAFARQAAGRLWMVRMGYGSQEEQLELARGALDRALALDPGSPEVHLALADHYGIRGSFERALEEIAIARSGLPGDSRVLRSEALILWFSGGYEEAVSSSERALELDPLDPILLHRAGQRLLLLRRFDRAQAILERSLELMPDNTGARHDLALVTLNRDGDPTPYLHVMSSPALPSMPWIGAVRWRAHILSRDYSGALSVLQTMDVEFERWWPFFPRPLLEGLTHRFSGNHETARTAFESARVLLGARVLESPDDSRVHAALGAAHAGLGHREVAIREAVRAVSLAEENGPLVGSIPHEVRIRLCAAWIYALIGEEDAAIESLAQVVSVPWGWTMNRLLNDPTFDGLHDNPSFQALLRKDRSEDWRN